MKDAAFSPDLFQKLFYSKTDEKRIVAQLLSERFEDRRFENALDVGAGPGDITEIVAQHAVKLTAVEPNSVYEPRLSARFPHAKILTTDIRRAPLDPEYDLVLLNQILYFIPAREWLSVCHKLIGRLREGGEFIVILNDHHSGDLKKIYEPYYERLRSYIPWDYMPLENLAAGLKTEGKTIDVAVYSYRVTYENLEEITTAIADVFLGINDAKIKQQYWPEFGKLAQSFRERDGTYRISANAKILALR
jgi:trans-aconitate methyltransferase